MLGARPILSLQVICLQDVGGLDLGGAPSLLLAPKAPF